MLKDLIALYFSPVRFFTSLRDRPRVLTAIILLVVVPLAGYATISEQLVDTAKEAAVEATRDSDQASRDHVEAIFDASWMRAAMVALPSVMQLVTTMLLALIGIAILAMTGGCEKGGFGLVARAAIWSKLVEIPHILLLVPMTVMKGDPEIYFGPAAFMEVDRTNKLFVLLTSFDIFNLWFLVLFIVGTKIVTGVSGVRAVAAVGLPWFVWQAVKLILPS